MEKKLPKVFANSIDKKLCNNEIVYYEKKDSLREIKKEKQKNDFLSDNFNINQKINKIFGSSKYVYEIVALTDVKLNVKY